MNKLLLLWISLVVIPLTGSIKWDSDGNTYYSTSEFSQYASFDEEKYNILCQIANECISVAILMDNEPRYAVLKMFVDFLKQEGSNESFVLLLDLNEIFWGI